MKAGSSVLIAAALSTLAVHPAAQQQTATFRWAVDVVAVPVQVVDRRGDPISTLKAGDFHVWLNGHERRVLSATFLTYPLPATTSPVVPSMAAVATNATVSVISPPNVNGRMVIVAVDESSLSPNAARLAALAARKFIDRLPADDVVGVYTYPFGKPLVDLQHDHGLASRSLDQVSGNYTPPISRYALSLSEILDVTAGDTGTLNKIATRVCEVDTRGCLDGIKGEAMMLAAHLETQSRQSLGELGFLLRGLHTLPGRKTVVLISGGLIAADRMGARPDVSEMVRSAAEQAAESDVVLYALHIDSSLLDGFSAAQKSTMRNSDRFESLPRDRTVQANGLERVAGEAGGAVFRDEVGAGEVGFDRILRETSGYYLLGVEPLDFDRDGRLHAIRVKSSAKGATVRARTRVVIPVRKQI